MRKFFGKRRILVFLAIVAIVFFVVFSQNIFSKTIEILNWVDFFQAALVSQSGFEQKIQEQSFLDDAPPQDFQIEEADENSAIFYGFLEEAAVVEAAEDLKPKTLTSAEIQEQLDDIAEKIDIITRQISDLANLAGESDSETLNQEQGQDKDEPDAEGELELQEQAELEPQTAKSEPKPVVSGGKPSYPKILISEVQTAGEDDEKREFVELHNPNSEDIGLTGWYLQKKTAGGSDWSTYASKNLFSGKTIFANRYFLIARTGYYLGSADIFTDGAITDDNSFALKNPNGDISDKLGFGNAQDPELMPGPNPAAGQSVGRIVLNGGSEWETDNNFNDFELQTPTPKMPNLAYTVPAEPPVEPPPPELENVLINEIQVEGDDVSDDWIELYNPNDIDIDISGYKLRKRTSAGSESSIRVLSESSVISAKGYYLWASSADDNFPPLVGADTWTKQNIAINNSIVLLNSNDIVLSALAWGVSENPFVEGAAFLDNPAENQSLGRIWSEEIGGYKNAGNNLEDFEVQTPTPKEKNIAWVEPPPEPEDTTPPEVIFMLDALQAELNFTINFEITDPFNVVTPSGLASYIFKWQEGGPLDNGWQEDPKQEIVRSPRPHNAQREFEGENGKTYFFQITAEDLLGNKSGWMPEIPAVAAVSMSDSPVIASVIISEIQILPIEQRFIELYNPNDSNVDLTGYYIQRKTKTATSWSSLVSSPNFEGKAIRASNYFLISREIENSDILLDITLSDDNLLVLKSLDGEVADKLGFGEAQDFEIAPAQNPLTGQSISRTGGVDTDNNGVDFMVFDSPSPGS